MVFSSIPAYLDPSNWQQPQNHQIIGNTSGGPNPLLHPPAQPVRPLLPPPPPPPHGSIRPGSMAERARLANIPMPEAALKCPRCESTNTKFCYFNNYSLSQPRHFCKTCRRYWTRGGALRTVPVGGGCRRNKRSSKSSSCSKSPASSSADPTRQTISSDNNNINNNNNNNNDNNSHVPSSTAISNLSPINGLGLGPLRFMPPLSHLAENFGGDHHHHHHNMGLGSSYPGPGEMGFQGSLGLIGGPVLTGDMAGSSLDPWRLQQQVPNFPFFGGLEQPYQFQGGDQPNFMAVGGQTSHHHGPRPKFLGSMLSQLAAGSVKMEESQAEVNLSRQLLGGNMAAGNEQWSGNPGGPSWTELSGFSTSSTSNPL